MKISETNEKWYDRFIKTLKECYDLDNGEEIQFFCDDKFESKYKNRLVRIDIENFMYIYPNDFKESTEIEYCDLGAMRKNPPYFNGEMNCSIFL